MPIKTQDSIFLKGTYMNWPDDAISIGIAVLLGTAIGLEREFSGKAAGLRTNVLICLGAAVFTIISKQMGMDTNTTTTRISAQIVTGVGFLGAGAIIRDRGGVLGLTTAATIWLVASIGMSCGAGYYRLAGVATLSAIIVLLGLRQIEKPIARRAKKRLSKKFSEDSPAD
jgi:putative Mg2+ transporter-C (MgtC) family protein